jgi:hypothetical protein
MYKSWLIYTDITTFISRLLSFVLAGELFFVHSFFVTNSVDAFSPKDIVLAYQIRGTMENYIKEEKNSFNLDKMNSHVFQVNGVKMMLSLLAYNFTNWLRTLSVSKELLILEILF